MLRLTKKADYGLMALKYLAEQKDGSAHSAKDIAEQLEQRFVERACDGFVGAATHIPGAFEVSSAW